MYDDDELLFKVVRTNGHDEVLARAANLIVGRAAYETAVRMWSAQGNICAKKVRGYNASSNSASNSLKNVNAAAGATRCPSIVKAANQFGWCGAYCSAGVIVTPVMSFQSGCCRTSCIIRAVSSLAVFFCFIVNPLS